MEKPNSSRSEDQRAQIKNANCTCSYCLLVISMRELSVRDAQKFRRHLQTNHGLKLGEPER
ncbi:MAG: hypothetical protein OK454_05135 [Thaumarchaeota archaeon]|nr:hypothetical protein [Nitrososphaerota archaeon]